ncbi:MAG TPA: hypothetical protein ENN40_03930 [Candidatus Aminicenantes bacterium]|nr:hypothetical protein [Candidatus Aminicenantes bacterium]
MNKKLIVPLVLLAVVFFAVALMIFLSSGKDQVAPTPADAADGTAEVSPADTVDLKLFYMDRTDWRMIPISKRIPRPATRTELYREFLRLLLQPREEDRAPVPEGTQIRALYYVEADRVLVLDFNQALMTGFPGGSRSELEFIQFIVNNICFNFREIRSVRIMVAGNEVKTLSGHIDLSRPFRPNFAFLKQDE